MTDSSDRAARLIGGRYRIDNRLGMGAFATTWRATDLNLRRTVAIKELRTDLGADAQFRARFEREAQAAASVSSEFTVQIYDVGQDVSSSWIVMEYLDGGSLRDLIDERGGRLGADESLRIMRQVLRGLDAIHAQGIVHRDLKPENVLFGGDGIARIADFGIVQVADQVGLTTTGTAFGTAAYMAPEQGRGEVATPATDLYAAGVMLYEMISGRLPYRAPTAIAMVMAHQNDRPPALADLFPQLAGISDVVQQAMAKDPARRFRSARAMVTALDEAPMIPARNEAVRPTPRYEQTVSMPIAPMPQRSIVPPPPQAPTSDSGGGSFIWWLLIVVMVGAVGGWLALQWLDDGQANPNGGPALATRTATEEDAVPTSSVVQIIEPIETNTPQPEPEATETDVPTEEATATVRSEPTNDEGEPTEPVQIEPGGGTPGDI